MSPTSSSQGGPGQRWQQHLRTCQKHTFVATPQAQRMEALAGTVQSVFASCKGSDTSSSERGKINIC